LQLEEALVPVAAKAVGGEHRGHVVGQVDLGHEKAHDPCKALAHAHRWKIKIFFTAGQFREPQQVVKSLRVHEVDKFLRLAEVCKKFARVVDPREVDVHRYVVRHVRLLLDRLQGQLLLTRP